MGWPSVRGFKDGEDAVTASVLNLPLEQLAERTEYLKRMLTSNDRTKVAIVDATVSDDGYGLPTKGQVVYRTPPSDAANLSTYARAAAVAPDDYNEWFYAKQDAMAVGVVSEIAGSTATVVLCGLIDFGTSGIPAANVIADAVPTSGRYYLSLERGKLTASPSGPVIYVCDCQVFDVKGVYYVRSMVVNPQYRDTGESHIHRAFVISGKPAGYAVRVGSTSGRFYAAGIVDNAASKSATARPTGLVLEPCGSWTYTGTDSIVYSVSFEANGSGGSGWAAYNLKWTSGGKDGTGSSVASTTTPISIGSHGLQVRLTPNSASASSVVGKTWTLSMPDVACSWRNYAPGGTYKGFKLDLGMYPALARYVPPLPENGAALTVGGLDLRGPVFGDREQWRISATDENGDAGPWLIWIGGEWDGTDSVTTPFVWNATIANQKERDIVLNSNRMRVGPTGFVTSLQPAPNSPLRVTSAQTGADANQGALQLSLDIDFKTSERNVEGNQVVKEIDGSTFKTGPVVERIVAGPGIAMSPEGGQGTVTLSISNAVYSGDFETIALKNAKQDLAGGVFPYTKLLSWDTGTGNVASGFSAKFRVPDHIPYKKYKVIVSASVFGEDGATADTKGAFSLTGYLLKDYTVNKDATDDTGFGGSIASPTTGKTSTILVGFSSGYTAFDPIVMHGFADRSASAQRQYDANLLLKATDGTAFEVLPGYFVGLNISRCSVPAGSGTKYTASMGFLSLRWNLELA